jgi:arsenite methyltransferase
VGISLVAFGMIGRSAGAGSALAAGTLLASAALFLHTTLRGKFVVWDDLLDQLAWTGGEHVIDLGCGRGAVLIAAAARVPRGRAVGVDLWRSVDQSGNAAAATRANAAAAGVADRVDLATADLVDLPFPDASFDVVLSALAIHNIHTRDGRRRALDEAVRVLRPGGHLIIVDIGHTRDYSKQLTHHGLTPIRAPLGWRYWYGGPWTAAHAITGQHPAP